MRRTAQAALAAALAMLLAPLSLQAQAPYPAHPVRMLVPFAPGGGTDTTARILGKKLAESLGQPIVIENRAGAGGNIAAEALAKAAPDGYTIMLGAVGPLAVAPHLGKLGYDPQRDFAPLTLAVAFGNVIVVHPAVPAQSLADYLRLAADPVKGMPFGTSGIAGTGHLAGELLKHAAKVNLVHVPYKGGGPAMTDLLGGQIPSMVASAPSAVPQIRAGKLRALAVTSAQRSPFLPEVPTVAESGFPGYEATNWYGFVAPARTPRAIVERLARELVAILRNPEVVEQLARHGMEPIPSSPEAMAAYAARETETWGRIVREANIRAE